MGMTILEALQNKKPCERKALVNNESLKVIYDLCRKHQAEIEEAFSRGYSWKQIDKACRKSWQEYSTAASGITWWKSGLLVADCYRAMKKGATVGKIKPTKEKAKPLSLKVTVEKR
ncbi:MAG: hypothetical protein IJS39_07340 [Synergistaceae bacterium]|nr:hypothetical protein [Synergistaceae bacterium]